jgi:hypothetical protein
VASRRKEIEKYDLRSWLEGEVVDTVLPIPTGFDEGEDARRILAMEFNGTRCAYCQQMFETDSRVVLGDGLIHVCPTCATNPDAGLIQLNQLRTAEHTHRVRQQQTEERERRRLRNKGLK